MPVVVKSGDTLGRIARRAGTTVAELLRLNPSITNANVIHPGQEIALPGEAPVVEESPPSSDSGDAEAPSAPAVQDDPMEELRARFPLAAIYMELDPELAGIVQRAAEEDWAADLIAENIQGSDWWRTRSEAQRQFDVEEVSDPAQMQAVLDGQVATLREQIQVWGLEGIDDGALADIAREVTRSGYNQTQIEDLVFGAALGFSETGTVGLIREGLDDIARSYLVDVAPDVLERRASDIAQGRDTVDGFRLWAENHAISAYGQNEALVSALERGQTVEDWADPYRQVAARTLELPEAAISLSDPIFRDPILSEGLSLGDWRQRLRSDSRFGWDGTQAARGEAFALVRELGRSFGRVA